MGAKESQNRQNNIEDPDPSGVNYIARTFERRLLDSCGRRESGNKETGCCPNRIQGILGSSSNLETLKMVYYEPLLAYVSSNNSINVLSATVRKGLTLESPSKHRAKLLNVLLFLPYLYTLIKLLLSELIGEFDVGSLTLDEIKKLAIIGLFSDDDLMEVFVLKGGNALDLVYNISPRASLDLDISLQTDLDGASLDAIRMKIETGLKRIFNEKGYEVFDVTLEEQPKTSKDVIPDFWGGYLLFFKILESDVFRDATAHLQDISRRAEVVGPKNRKKFKVDISKHEYCEPKKAVDFEGYRIYVYTPEMIVFEKLRAICQQTEEYCSQIGKTHRQARARDFFDIYTIIKHFNIDVTDPNNLDLLKNIFLAKKVPLKLLTVISEYRNFHRSDFASVQDTLKPGERIRDFDYYFDYVVTECDDLSKTLWVI